MRPDRMIKSEEPFLNSEERNETNLFDFVKCDSTPYQICYVHLQLLLLVLPLRKNMFCPHKKKISQTFQATGTCKMLVAENDSE
jgi:hypothetical protein